LTRRWDIKGKALNAPVWQLLGGLVRDKIKAYSWVGGDRPAEVIAGINTLRGMGFDTFKLNGCQEMGMIDSSRTVDAAVNTVAQIREAFGNDIEFGLDFHGRVSAPMAKLLIKELEPYRPLFIEEPVLAEQAEYYPRLAAQTAIPLAAGERMFSRFEFKRVWRPAAWLFCSPISLTPAASPNASKSPVWRKRRTCRWLRTAR
jgi:galactonate dehydratase